MIALAPIVVVIAALFCLLVYYGAEQLGKVIIAWTPDISIPHVVNLKSIVTTVVTYGVDVVRAITQPFTGPIVDFIQGTALWVLRIIYGATSGVFDAAVAIHRLLTVVLPARLSWLRDWARGLVAAAVTELGARLHDLRDAVFNALGNVRDWVTALVATEVAALVAKLHDLRDWTSQRILGVEADVAAVVRSVEHDITSAVHTAEVYASEAANLAERAAVASIDLAATTATAVIDTIIIDEIPALLDAIATDFPDIGAALRGIDLSKVTDLAGVLALTGAISLALTRYLRECGIPNCRNLGSYGRYLSDLLSLIGAGSLFAALAELVTDPEAAARETVDALDSVLSAGAGVFRDLIGA